MIRLLVVQIENEYNINIFGSVISCCKYKTINLEIIDRKQISLISTVLINKYVKEQLERN